MAGFEVSRSEMPKPSNASLHSPSVRVFHSPFDLPKAVVCILEEAVSRGYKVIKRVAKLQMLKIKYTLSYCKNL